MTIRVKLRTVIAWLQAHSCRAQPTSWSRHKVGCRLLCNVYAIQGIFCFQSSTFRNILFTIVNAWNIAFASDGSISLASTINNTSDPSAPSHSILAVQSDWCPKSVIFALWIQLVSTGACERHCCTFSLVVAWLGFWGWILSTRGMVTA